jgi:UDP-N-acetylmuramoyl-L-alanyl-D-glutamate--2,6-diaminopimelate ligase
VRLSSLLSGWVGDPDPQVCGLAYDSRRVQPGFLFFCIPGLRRDGHDFLGEAWRRGAVAAVVEKPVAEAPLPVYRVDNCRRALARTSAVFYGHPAAGLTVVGISGTNGKTTVSYWLEAIYARCGFATGLIGTIQYRCGGFTTPSGMTTPESLDLQALLYHMSKKGASHVVMEVSSHALALERVFGLAFDCTVLTNVTHDHLDFHRDLEDYRAVKAGFRKFLRADGGLFVTNADDPFCAALKPGEGAGLVSFGFGEDSLVRARDYVLGSDGTRAVISLGGYPLPVRLNLPGQFNLANACAAAAVAFGQGVEPDLIREGLESLTAVPGRCEAVDTGAGFRVVIDFAHNPDALAKLLTLAPPEPYGRKILVFGCEGGKDRTKRPLMGAVAASQADYAILTCDNVHNEEPEQIFREVMVGMGTGPGNHEIVPDRCLAIKRALELAERGDLVLVAGKGHEDQMVVRGQSLPFSDREVVNNLMGSEAAWPTAPLTLRM